MIAVKMSEVNTLQNSALPPTRFCMVRNRQVFGLNRFNVDEISVYM